MIQLLSSKQWCSSYQLGNDLAVGDSVKKCSDVYFLLIVAMIILLLNQSVLLRHQATMVSSEQMIYIKQ